MNVIRTEKTKDYSVISNQFLRDPSMSYKAKGLLANVMTHSNAYQFTVAGVVATSKEGRDAVYSIIGELIKLGYCERNYIRDPKGFVKDVEYVFYEQSRLLPALPDTAEPETAKPDTDNPTQRSTNNKEVQKERSINAQPPVEAIPDFDKLDSKKDLMRGFDEFWSEYGLKKARAKCETTWRGLKDKDKDAILACVKDHYLITAHDGGKYRPHPSTWLNQRRWEDDIEHDLQRAGITRRKTEYKKTELDEW